MCGIAGLFRFDPESPVDPDALTRMCDAIVHRGPDDQGTMVAGSVGLAMRRLSIIDLAHGHQPISNEDGTVTIVFNGEIYNHPELRQALEGCGHHFRTNTDTECIVHAYEEYGPACVEHLNGMFAFAIWDAREQVLFLARDRAGIKPLYLHETASGVAFASEIKSLLATGAVPREIDYDAFLYFFRYGYVASPATLLRHVRQLPPAHYAIVGRHRTTVRRYWSVPAPPSHPSGISEDEYAERIADLFARAVRRQLISDVPLGAFLSGGLDSSSIVSVMSDAGSEPVNTYAIGFEGADTFHNELDDARFMARHCATHHHEIVVRPDVASLIPRLVRYLDQPLSDSSFVVTYLVSELARQTVKVIISGVGGDELFGGYRRYLGPSLDRYYDRVPAVVRGALSGVAAHVPVDRGSALGNYARLARSFVSSHGLSSYERYDRSVRLLTEDVLDGVLNVTAAGESPLCRAREQQFSAVNGGDPVAQMQTLDLHTSLPDSLLLLTDRMTMAVSIEARVPFLDHELVELAASVPSRLKVHGTRLRHIQKRSMARRLPARVLTKKKRGFGCPVGAWFRHDLKPLLLDTVSPSTLRRHGLFDPAAVSKIVNDHMTFREDYSELLLSILTTELWYGEQIAP